MSEFDKKTKIVQIRVSDKERDELKKKAKQAKKTVSQHILDSALGEK